ncbi:MAG: shikimate kinase [Pseudomonadota bacterium]
MKLKHIALIGLKSCGKTTVGQALAKQLDYRYNDTDQIIEHLYVDQAGERLDFRSIYQKLGNDRFRQLETQAIEQAVANRAPSVIATGGGSLLNQHNVEKLVQHSVMIYLKASVDTLKERWLARPPSFINPKNLSEELSNYYAKRAKTYTGIATITIVVDEKTPDEIVTDIIMALNTLAKM